MKQSLTISHLCQEHGVSRAVVSLALEQGQLVHGFGVDARGRRCITDPVAARAALRKHLADPPKLGRPPAPSWRATQRTEGAIEWRREAIAVCVGALAALDELERTVKAPKVLAALADVRDRLEELDGLLADGAHGPEL